MVAEFGVELDWLSYELYPEEIPWDTTPRPPQVETNRPKTPSRLELAYAAQGMDWPTVKRPKLMRIHNALEATEYVKSNGNVNEFIERMYRAYWEEGREINAIEVIQELAEGLVPEVDHLVKAVENREFDDRIVKFDDDAYASGVYNVPTFFIGGERYAEQSYRALSRALHELKTSAS